MWCPRNMGSSAIRLAPSPCRPARRARSGDARSGSRSWRGRRRSAGPAAGRQGLAAGVQKGPVPGRPARRRPAAPGESPAGLPNRRNTVPLPRPARSTSPSMVSLSAPCSTAIISRAGWPAKLPLCAASARSRAALPGRGLVHWGAYPTVEFDRRGKSGATSPDGGCRTPRRTPVMSTTTTPDRFRNAARRADAPGAAVPALEEHGFNVETVVDNLGAAREAVMARIPHGSSVMTNTSVTPGRYRHRRRDQRRRAVWVGAQRHLRARLRHPGPADEGDQHGQTRLRPRQRAHGHPGRNPRHRLGFRQPARRLRLGRRQRDLRHRRAETRPNAGRGTRADLPAQPGCSRTPARGPPTGSTARSGRSWRYTRSCPTASTSSLSANWSGSDEGPTKRARGALGAGHVGPVIARRPGHQGPVTRWLSPRRVTRKTSR